MESGADIIITPVEKLPLSDLSEPSTAATLAYGDSLYLRHAFLHGCRDYLKNPWSPEELTVRLHKILEERMKNLRFSWGIITLEDNRLSNGKTAVELSYRENRLLRILLAHRGECLTRQDIYFGLHGIHLPAGSRVIDVHISALNRKTRSIPPAHFNGNLIESVRNSGYVIP